jgi:Tfp pilus assembly protein PilV
MSRCLACAAVVLGFVLAACGAGSREKDSRRVYRTSSGDEMICHQEYPTGSNIGRTVCRTEETRAEDRAKGREFVNAPRAVPPKREQAPPAGR